MILNSPYISGSLTVTGNIITSGSITLSGSVASASYAASATSASYALNATSASFATRAITASYSDALTVAGTLTAQTLVVQTITSSVDYVTGSTQFGSISANTHQFTGSVLITGSIGINLTSSSALTGSLTVQSMVSASTSGPVVAVRSSYTNKKIIAELAEYSYDGTLVLRHALATTPTVFITSQTGGTAHTYFNHEGSVLIGNNSPAGAEKLGVTRDDGVTDGLHIIADFNRAGSSSAELILGYYASASAVTGPVVYAANSQPLLFGAGSAERMRLTTTGYLGIGATSPSARLHVVGFAGGSVPGATGIPSLGFANSSSVALFTNNDINYGTLFGTLNTGVGWIQQQRVDGTGTAYNLVLQPSGGNVGIGISSPVSTDLIGALTIVKKYQGDTPTSTTAQLYYTNQSALYLFGRNSGISIISNNNEEGHIQFGNASTTRYARITTGTGTSAVGGDMYFHVGSDTERMRITSGGNVGIGTTNPSAKLEIKGSADPYDILIGRYHGGNAKLIYAYQSGADGYLELRTGADTTVTKLSGYTGTPSYFLSRVLVGQTTSDLGQNGWNLQADGGGHTSFAINNNEAFIFNNRNTGTTFEIDFRTNATERGKISVTDSGVSYITTPSDLNLKKNFEDWNENVLNNFKNLNPQKFNFKVEEDDQPKTKGFIAQELVESFPEAYPKSKDRYFFNPSGMVIYLMKAIQELKAQNDDLQSQINELKAQ